MIVFLMYFAHEVLKVNQKNKRRRYPHNSDFYLPTALCSKGGPYSPLKCLELMWKVLCSFFFLKQNMWVLTI